MTRLGLGIAAIVALAGSAVMAQILPAASVRASTVNLHMYANGWDSRYRSPFGAAPTHSTVTLRLQAGPKVQTAVLYVSSPKSHSATQYSMILQQKKLTATIFAAHFTTPAAPTTLHYYFKAEAGKTVQWYGDSTSGDDGPGQTYAQQSAVTGYGITVYLKSFKVPSWMTHAVIYQIFPDRYYNGDTANDPKTGTKYGYITAYFHKNWSDTPQDGPIYSSDFFGGDLQGIIDKLSYIHGLGVNVIYLNPIFLAPSDHKYDTGNYKMIDPEFGTLQTFKTLLADAKALGIRVILDGVFNHTGSDSVYFNRYSVFNDVGAYQNKNSPYYSWYTFYNWPNNYDDFYGIDTLPTLTETPAVENFIFKKPSSVAQYWLGLGASGWRLDHVIGKSHTWWQAFRNSVQSAYPKSVSIGEVFQVDGGQPLQDPTSYLMGNELDGVTNYRFRDDVLNYFAGGTGADMSDPINAATFLNSEMGLLSETPRPAILSSMNLVDSHDTMRILTSLHANKQALRLVALYQMTWLGAPTVFYGDETGILGVDNNVARATFPWGHDDASLEAYYRGIIAMREQYPALTQGSVVPLFSQNSQRVVGYLRQSGQQKIVVLLNDSSKSQKISIPVTQIANGTKLTDVVPGQTDNVSVTNGHIIVTIPALSGQALLAGAQ